MTEETFNPVDYGLLEGTGRGAAHKRALQARNARMKELRKRGKNVTGYSLPNQVITRGGEFSTSQRCPSPPHSFVVTVYYLHYI